MVLLTRVLATNSLCRSLIVDGTVASGRDESKDSLLKNWKFGVVKYVTDTESLPDGCGSGRNSWSSWVSRRF